MSDIKIDITGFKELERKIKHIKDDSLKRKQLLSLMKASNTGLINYYRQLTPKGSEPHSRYKASGKKKKRKGPNRGKILKTYQGGNLAKSVGNIVAKRGIAKVNAIVHVGPKVSKGRKLRKYDGYYGHMVTKKGSGVRDSSVMLAVRDKAAKYAKTNIEPKVVSKINKQIQKQIDKLSNV